MRLIESAISERRPVLGVCLGAQLVAAALGARVSKGERREIGWRAVKLASAAQQDRLFRGVPESFVAMHWHGDVFDLPAGAVALASSDQTPLQAFRYGDNAWAIQFHIEVTRREVEAFVREFGADIEGTDTGASEILSRADQCTSALEPIAETVFSRWASPIQGT
jgi:GMP synthase (glutamine-hydrolysing)